jgi:uncharacterized protein Yka (UPF0111/DUF47 family)
MAQLPAATAAPESGHPKQEIVLDLGESSLALPLLINRGLEANDRAKYYLALIQAALAHADHPDRPFSSLRAERLAAGVPDEALDSLVGRSRATDASCSFVPDIGSVHAALVAAVAEMIAPFEVAPSADNPFSVRLASALASAPDVAADGVPGAYVDRMVSADRGSGDSIHLLIMDVHRALNQLQLEVATENLDGASVYGLTEDDRSLVALFMAGVRSTDRLKFDHPGLGTTATRAGARVLIQNDIGMTEAHVIVITVEDLVVTVTYSDVHLERLHFFESMLDGFDVQWTDVRQQVDHEELGRYHLVSGRLESGDRATLEEYLRFLGSRLVFLIDWNRARRRIASVVKKREAISLLRWAADEGCGHMAFLKMGAERLVYEAVELTGRVPARFGESLSDSIGTEATLDVLRFAIRCSSEGMQVGKSRTLVRDEIRVELLKHLRAVHQQLIDLAAEHGTLVVESSEALRAALTRLGMSDGVAYGKRAAGRAAAWEHRADEILTAVRLAAGRVEGADAIVSTVASLDDSIDDLEEALFLLTLLPPAAIQVVCPILEPLAGTTVFAAREHLKALEIARQLVGGVGDDELEDFLLAVDQVVTLEHEADGADRTARGRLVSGCPDFRSLHVADLVSCAMESATDGLSHAAFLLRDHILGQVAAR